MNRFDGLARGAVEARARVVVWAAPPLNTQVMRNVCTSRAVNASSDWHVSTRRQRCRWCSERIRSKSYEHEGKKNATHGC